LPAHALAVKRGVAVRDDLSSLKLPTDRLFLGTAKAVPPGAKWTPRAELNLATELGFGVVAQMFLKVRAKPGENRGLSLLPCSRHFPLSVRDVDVSFLYQ
jgi:hypothetical protein